MIDLTVRDIHTVRAYVWYMITNSISKLGLILVWKIQMNVAHPSLCQMQLVVLGLDQENSERFQVFFQQNKILSKGGNDILNLGTILVTVSKLRNNIMS